MPHDVTDSPDQSPMAKPTEQDCRDLMRELHITPQTGAAGITGSGFFVMIYAKVKRPAMVKFRGWPVRYFIGGGIPRAPYDLVQAVKEQCHA